MMPSIRYLACLPLLLALSGCVNLGLAGDKDASPIIYYVIQDGGRATTHVSASPHSLLIGDTMASAFYDSDGMAFSSQPGTRGYYRYARWSERPGRRFTELLLSRLEREKTFSVVTRTSGGVRGDWLLSTEIIDLYHDAEQKPGAVKMELRAEVVDLKTRALLARRTFTQNVAVASFDAAGAHQAFNAAATRMLDEMTDWLKALSEKS